MRLLDLFCGAGGAGAGYRRAGFDDIVGIDIKAQPNYPFSFVQADALEWMEEWVLTGHEHFDVIHASPPCQAHVKGLAAVNRKIGRDYDHNDYISETREMLSDWADRFGGQYVIENVVGSPLLNPVRLCGSSFRLPLRRHRLFESNMALLVPPCDHSWQTEKKYWTSDRSVRLPDGTRKYQGGHRRATVVQVYGDAGERHEWPVAMDIDWMTYEELAEAIPPAYTELIGTQLIAYLRAEVA